MQADVTRMHPLRVAGPETSDEKKKGMCGCQCACALCGGSPHPLLSSVSLPHPPPAPCVFVYACLGNTQVCIYIGAACV